VTSLRAMIDRLLGRSSEQQEASDAAQVEPQRTAEQDAEELKEASRAEYERKRDSGEDMTGPNVDPSQLP
jgi:hypothetical protein